MHKLDPLHCIDTVFIFSHHISPQIAQEMIDQKLANRIRHKIQDDRTHDNVSYYTQFFSDADYGTTHVAVLAPNGDAVSVTTTINFRSVSNRSYRSATVERRRAWVGI